MTHLFSFSSRMSRASFSMDRCLETVDGASPRTAVISHTQSGRDSSIFRMRRRFLSERALNTFTLSRKNDSFSFRYMTKYIEKFLYCQHKKRQNLKRNYTEVMESCS